MIIGKSPGAVAALGASVVDQLGRQVIQETNRQQQLTQAAIRTAGGAGDRAMMAASSGGAQRRLAFRTPEQRSADLLAAQEFQQITKFVAACRRQWPGAMILLRPDGAPLGAGAPTTRNQHLEQSNDRFRR
jgi:hypothetical protein